MDILATIIALLAVCVSLYTTHRNSRLNELKLMENTKYLEGIIEDYESLLSRMHKGNAELKERYNIYIKYKNNLSKNKKSDYYSK